MGVDLDTAGERFNENPTIRLGLGDHADVVGPAGGAGDDHPRDQRAAFAEPDGEVENARGRRFTVVERPGT